MNINLIQIGKTQDAYLTEGVETYTTRLKHYVSYKTTTIPSLKNVGSLSLEQLKKKEGELILKNIHPTDFAVLLDERGKEYRSTEFAGMLEKSMHSGKAQMVFIIGGAYGVSEEIKTRANQTMSFSRMTFSHQMIRLFFVEQLYRAMSIIRKESYHHE